MIAGEIWLFTDLFSEASISVLGAGFYVSSGAALVGLFLGIVAFVKTQFRVVDFKEVL
jgi:hypothetical protein